MEVEKILMKMPVNPDFISVIRLTTSGIASTLGFSFDDIEDIKVCISEACTNAIKHSKKDEFEIEFTVYKDRLSIKVKDDGVGVDVDSIEEPDLENPKTSGLGLYIIRTLMDDVEVVSCEDCGTVISMTKVIGVKE